MEGNMWMRIIIAALLGLMIWRMYPITKNWLKNGPRGSSSEWLNVALLLGGVVLFVLLLGRLL